MPLQPHQSFFVSAALTFGLSCILLTQFSSTVLALQDNLITDITNQTAAVVQDESQGRNVTDPRLIAFSFIQIFLSILGTIFFGLVLLSGWHYLTAHGRPDKVEEAMNMMRRAVIGLVIIFAAFGITQFAISTIKGAVEEGYQYTQQRQRLNSDNVLPN